MQNSPDEAFSRIAAAMHRAMHYLADGQPEDVCLQYTMIGHYVVRDVLGVMLYPVAGSLQILTGRGEEAFTIGPESRDRGTQSYHAWLESKDSSHALDFASRHYPSWLAKNDRPWMHETSPDYIWAPYQQYPDYVRLLPGDPAFNRKIMMPYSSDASKRPFYNAAQPIVREIQNGRR